MNISNIQKMSLSARALDFEETGAEPFGRWFVLYGVDVAHFGISLNFRSFLHIGESLLDFMDHLQGSLHLDPENVASLYVRDVYLYAGDGHRDFGRKISCLRREAQFLVQVRSVATVQPDKQVFEILVDNGDRKRTAKE